MFTMKKIMAVMLISCVIAAGAWYASHSQHSQSGVVNPNIRKDSFAEYVGRKIAVASKLADNHVHAVIFDNDAATDDALALILIGNDPGVILKAITVAGTGEAHGRRGAENMAALANVIGRPDVPVAYGHARPLSRAGKPFPDFVRTAMDNLLAGTGVKPDAGTKITDHAVGLIRHIVETSPEKITILATGPLTNIAEFVTQYPQLKSKIERIVIMGGAIHVEGNIHKVMMKSDNKVSEWNFYADPEAVSRVFAAQIPITLVALDATSQVPMTKKFYESIAREEQPDLRVAHRLLKNLVTRFGMQQFVNNIYMWDGLAAMIMLDPSMAEITPMNLTVDVTNGQVRAAAAQQHTAAIDVVTKILRPEAALSNYVATVKSNHIFAQHQFHYNAGRVTADLGRPVIGMSATEQYSR